MFSHDGAQPVASTPLFPGVIYLMLTRGEEYVDRGEAYYEERHKHPMSATYVRGGKVDWIAKGTDVGVQKRALGPGGDASITDTTYCIEDSIQIDMLDPPERVVLAVGERHPIPTHRPHQLTAHGGRPCRFLLIQGVGAYARHPIDPATWAGTTRSAPR